MVVHCILKLYTHSTGSDLYPTGSDLYPTVSRRVAPLWLAPATFVFCSAPIQALVGSLGGGEGTALQHGNSIL